jgi:PEP-CTERM motif
MKQNTKWFATALAVAGGLMIANLAQAQGVTGTPYLSNMDPSTLNTSPSALYPSWDTATITSQATGLEVNATNYGSLYYVIPNADVQTLNVNDTIATLTLTINDNVANYLYVGIPFILGDNSGSTSYGGYSGPGNPGTDPGAVWSGNTVTITESLSPTQVAAIQAGNDAIYSFNLEFDPASMAGPPIYDITFNSLVLSPGPVPEPTTLALAGLGAIGLLAFRRRK